MACIACSVKKVKFASEDTIYYRRLSIGSASRTKRSLRQKCSERFPLIIEYIKLYIKGFPYYSFKFIVSRIVATIIHVFK
nr:hypothetical protein BACY1_18320 [Tenacibaculum mesophilum]